MDRRRFIGLAGLTVTTVLTSPSGASAQGGGRVAVVVGVDKPGNLPVLSAAASGAREVATWLRSEGFDVKLFTDETSPVKVAHLKESIRDYLDAGNVRQLVVYFAGHGFVNQLSEFWMLSGAPEDPDEAVNLVGSVLLARLTTVPNVVVISDACRSAPSDLGISNVQGSLIFPNRGRTGPAGVSVDQFLATRVGEAAYEEKLADSVGKFHGLFTTSFLSAFKDPPSEMVDEVDGMRVVPNRRLKKYLLADLPSRAQSRNILLRQLPDSNVTSDDDVYIGRARYTAASKPSATSSTSPEDFAARDIFGLEPPSTGGGRPELSRARDYVNAKRGLLSASPVVPSASLGHSTILVVAAKGVDSVRVSAGLRASLPGGSEGDAVSIEIADAQDRAFSVAIRFLDGTGTVLAGLPRHDATVLVRDGGVASVVYSPRGTNSDVRQLSDLRAAVTAAASIGAFRLPDRAAADRFEDQIRASKGVDPTLGLFAAYAYLQAGRLDQLVPLSQTMKRDLGTVPFDVAMLAASAGAGSAPSPGDFSNQAVVPPCPMLAQGWNLLEATGSAIPQEFKDARPHLKQALWTTFDRRGMDIVLEARIWRP